jgi:hypothetical protein
MKRASAIIVIGVFFLHASVCMAGDATADSDSGQDVAQEPPLHWYDMFTNIPGDWARNASQSFTSEKIPAFVGLGALTVALLASDHATWEVSRSWYEGSDFVRHSSDAFVYVGDGRTQFGLVACFAGYGFAGRDARALRTASQMTEAILATGVVVQVFKHIAGRQRPIVSSVPAGKWSFLPNQIQYHRNIPFYDAFPSGHMATTIATITVVAENYPEISWIRPVGYCLAGAMAIGLVNTGTHWYSDFPLAIALGYSFGMIAAHPIHSSSPSSHQVRSGPQFSIAPTMGPAGSGLLVSLQF